MIWIVWFLLILRLIIHYNEICRSSKDLHYRRENCLDIYFVKIYPKEHKDKIFEDFDMLEWLSLFTKTRKKNIEKGFL